MTLINRFMSGHELTQKQLQTLLGITNRKCAVTSGLPNFPYWRKLRSQVLQKLERPLTDFEKQLVKGG